MVNTKKCELVDYAGRPLRDWSGGYCSTKWLFKMSEFAPKCRKQLYPPRCALRGHEDQGGQFIYPVGLPLVSTEGES